MSNALLLLQMSDSNFPIGSFSHSFGFETYMMAGKINNADEFAKWLDTYLYDQVVLSDGYAVARVVEALDNHDLASVCAYNEQLNALLSPKEVRDANLRMGRQFLKLAKQLHNDETLDAYQNLIKEKRISPHQAIVYTLLAHNIGVDQKTTIETYLMNMLISIVQNAVRGIPIGQVAGQRLIFSYQDLISKWSLELIENVNVPFGVASPGLEIAQMQHEFLRARNFMS
ncbi:hypothetical protein AWM75_08115 [Aerococcus urinaehominis]|uniref:Urease accessory protein UreF n=1 Tax=Aerococcus urinaehominis TaxID=128944 RepID=A0A109RH71_9LACT|nr:urease accessory protein UreF [Aerococcus urinaehominis]AMB99936.1 hypothetical protein AWM75_08115 [Aerococcus urinaehominis]SDM42789.1 urease accessory protein [Aerococcus urinaehominis]